MKISTILDQIDAGQMALPEFQRGYVWTGEQVRRLMYALYRHEYSRSEVNAIANLTFQTREGHAYWISDRKPEDYLEEVEQKFPGAVASHWIPTDRALESGALP